MQALHGLIELTGKQQRQQVEAAADGIKQCLLVLCRRPTEHPRGDAIFVSGVTNADAQAVKLTVTKVRKNIPQAILATMAAVEFQARRTRRKIQIVVYNQALFRFDPVVTQGRSDRMPAAVHERGRLQQAHALAIHLYLTTVAVQLGLKSEAAPSSLGQGIGKPEADIVPVAQVLRPGIAQTDD